MRNQILILILLLAVFVYADTISIELDIPSNNYVMNNIHFDADISGGETPYTYFWQFGDGKNSTSSSPNYDYTTPGQYTVSLNVTDNTGTSFIAQKTILIEDLSNILNILLNETDNILSNASSEFGSAQSPVLDIITTTNLKKQVDDTRIKISQFRSEYETAKGASNQNLIFSQIYTNLTEIRKNIPLNVKVDLVVYNPVVTSSNQIPDGIISDKEEVFTLQQYLTSTGKAYSVNIGYLSNKTESYILIKKQITLSRDLRNSVIYEYVPVSVAPEISNSSITTIGAVKVNKNIIKFPVSGRTLEIVYKLDYGSFNKINEVKTILYSSEIPVTQEQTGFNEEPICGDGICNPLEEGYCNVDCKKKVPWFWLTLLFIILALGVYYINFYKGPYNFKELANIISMKLFKKRIFISNQDMINLEGYIEKSMKYGLNEKQISNVLLKKGWTQKQLDYVFNKIKEKKKTGLKINQTKTIFKSKQSTKK